MTFCQANEKTWVVFRASIPVLGLQSRSLVTPLNLELKPVRALNVGPFSWMRGAPRDAG